VIVRVGRFATCTYRSELLEFVSSPVTDMRSVFNTPPSTYHRSRISTEPIFFYKRPECCRRRFIRSRLLCGESFQKPSRLVRLVRPGTDGGHLQSPAPHCTAPPEDGPARSLRSLRRLRLPCSRSRCSRDRSLTPPQPRGSLRSPRPARDLRSLWQSGEARRPHADSSRPPRAAAQRGAPTASFRYDPASSPLVVFKYHIGGTLR
jgi:hypothetical protein